MAPSLERTLSEFMDAWNAGKRPEVDDYIARVPPDEQAELADQLTTFLAFAPTPDYDDAALEAIRAEPIVQAVLGAQPGRAGLLPALFARLRDRVSMTTPELAEQVVEQLGLPAEKAPKTAGYLERLESGELEPSRISRRVFEALSRVFGVPSGELEGAGGLGAAASAAPAFRAEADAAASVQPHLEVLADALEAPGGEARDEVDDLFLGGR